jgi:hypothetical protein
MNCLRPFEHWGLGFESPLEAWMSVCVYPVFVLLSVWVAALRGTDPPSKESCRLCIIRLQNRKTGLGPTKGSRTNGEWIMCCLIRAIAHLVEVGGCDEWVWSNGWIINKKKKGKAIPVIGCVGPEGCETSRFPHFLDSWLTDGGEVVSLIRRPPFTLRQGKNRRYSEKSLFKCHFVHHKSHKDLESSRAAAVESRRLTAWAMARPISKIVQEVWRENIT